MSSNYNRIFVSKHWAIRLLWTTKYQKNQYFRQLWRFITFDWSEIGVWNYYYRWSTARSMSHKNFSHLHCFVRSRKSSEKWVFIKTRILRVGYLPKYASVWKLTNGSWKYSRCPRNSWKNYRGISRNCLYRRSSLRGFFKVATPWGVLSEISHLLQIWQQSCWFSAIEVTILRFLVKNFYELWLGIMNSHHFVVKVFSYNHWP
jgi:hypothetical protein